MQKSSRPSLINRELLFASGFGGSTRLVPAVGPYFHGPRDQYEDIVGSDSGMVHTWDEMSRHPNLGHLRIYYEGGDPSQRSAQIVPDEQSPENKILRFQLTEPNVTIHWPTGPESKSRVQAELYANKDLHELYQTVRLRMPPEMQALENFPGTFHWLTLFEFWNEPFWLHQYPFRITIGVQKPEDKPGCGLIFGVEAQKMIATQRFETLWSESAHSFRIPFGTWMDVELYYREGAKDQGRLFLAVTPQGGERQVLFDVCNYTHHPDNPAPAGLTHYNPMKMYTSAELVEFMRGQGRSIQTDWDDLALWKGRIPPEHTGKKSASPHAGHRHPASTTLAARQV